MATINAFYKQHAMEFSTVSEDGMVVTMPSEKKDNVFYNVYCKETAHGVEAVSCQCYGFSRYHRCKHLVIVNEWLDAQAPTPVVEETKITEIEPNAWYILNSNTQVWRDAETGQWLAAGPTANAIELVETHLEKQQAVKAAEEIVAQPIVVEQAGSDEQTFAQIATQVGVPAEEVAKIAVIAAEHKQAMAPKHSDMCLPIGPRDTKRDIKRKTEQEIDLGFLGSLNTSQGFQMWK